MVHLTQPMSTKASASVPSKTRAVRAMRRLGGADGRGSTLRAADWRVLVTRLRSGVSLSADVVAQHSRGLA